MSLLLARRTPDVNQRLPIAGAKGLTEYDCELDAARLIGIDGPRIDGPSVYPIHPVGGLTYWYRYWYNFPELKSEDIQAALQFAYQLKDKVSR